MKRRTFSFFILLLVLTLGVIFASFVKYYLLKEYWIEAWGPCDQTTEACFIYVCDPEVEECTGNPEEDTTYYKIIRRVAADTPLCDPNDESCVALSCEGSSEDVCQEILCDPASSAEEECTNPEDFKMDSALEDGLEDAIENSGEEGIVEDEARAVNGEGPIIQEAAELEEPSN